jgi:CHASE2 domain-containing sensor protein
MLAVALFGLLAGYAVWHTGVGRNLELQTVDARFTVRGTQKPWPGVVIVGIDSASRQRFGLFPYPRRVDAVVVDRLREAGARTIAFDLVFAGQTDQTDDLRLFDAVRRTRGRTVVAGTATNASGQSNVFGGPQVQRAAGVGVGSALFPVDHDGTIRRVPESVEGLQSFAVAAARGAGLPSARLRSLFSARSQWIDFPGPAGTVKTYSFSDVYNGVVPRAALRGRIVVIGATAGELQDVHTVSGWASSPMSGPEIEADAIATLMNGAPLRSAPPLVNWLVLIVASLLLPALAWRRVPWPRLVWVGLAAAAAALVGTQIAFDTGTITVVVPPLTGLLVSGVGAVLVPLGLERRELAALRGLRDRFARFDPGVVDAVLADPGVALRLRALAIGPESVIAGYRIVSLIGRGGMGVVYEAVQLALGRPVALKLIDPARADDEEFRARFVRESHIAAGLEHPHVIPVYEAREDEGLLFIAMRLARGPSLADVLATEAPLTPVYAARLTIQIASALGAAHARGLVHRDVKPANILLHDREHAYLTDFGITREIGDEGLTAAGERVGTVDYMAPEQARGESVGPAADIYSLGCVLYEAVTARVPYPADSEVGRIVAHLHDPPPRASEHWPGVPPALDAVIAQALDKQPGGRFVSAAEFSIAVARAVGIESVAEPLPEPLPRAHAGADQPTMPSG